MVVQDNNFRELLDFILMCEKYKVDSVQLQIIEPDFIRDLGYGDYLKEWVQKAVHEKNHPNHNELLNILKDDFFNIYIDRSNGKAPAGTAVIMGQLFDLRNGNDISQYDQLLVEEKELKRIKDGLALAEKGLLKDVWFEGETYFVAPDAVKKINGTDVAELPTGETVVWNKDEEEWIKYYARR